MEFLWRRAQRWLDSYSLIPKDQEVPLGEGEFTMVNLIRYLGKSLDVRKNDETFYWFYAGPGVSLIKDTLYEFTKSSCQLISISPEHIALQYNHDVEGNEPSHIVKYDWNEIFK